MNDRPIADETTAPTDAVGGAPTPSDTSWPPIRRLGAEGRYHLEEQIAAGGAATVWRAYDEHLDRSVAIKILHPHLVNDEDTVRRFERESRNAARLHHPNAIRIFDSGRVNDVVYLVMEFVDGPTLKDVLQDHGALAPWTVVAAIGEQIATALAEAHAQGLIHRDIKPANILFTTDGVVKVVDFGIAKALSATTAELTVEGTTVGTATYIAPEQYAGEEVDERVDIYALGMVLFECLTGRPAFVGDTPTATAAARLTRDIVPPRQVRADVDRRLEDVVVRCARRDPSERFGDAAAVAHALRQMVTDAEPHELTRNLIRSRPPAMPRLPEFPDVDPNAITDPGLPAGGRRSRGRLIAAFLAGMALTAVVVAAVTRDDGASISPPTNADGTVSVSTVDDFDPFGVGAEEEQALGNLIDLVPPTTWDTATFTGEFPGVGVVFDLGEGGASIETIELYTETPGSSIEIYRAIDEVPDPEQDGLPGWGEPVAVVESLDSYQPVPLQAPQDGRFWLVWLSELPENDQGIQRGDLAEVRFFGEALSDEPAGDDT